MTNDKPLTDADIAGAKISFPRSRYDIEHNAICDELLKLRSEAAQRRWQPIETAPMDGTNVIVYGLGECVPSEARYIEGDGWYLAGNDPTDAWGGPVYPTHWKPLDAPPSTEGQS